MSRLKFLDGFRGWAALFVVFYHVFCEAFPLTATSGPILKQLLPFSGLYAVMVFFLVSGFSISIRFLATGDRRSLCKIAAGRYFRLVIPVFAACLTANFIVLSGLLAPATERLPIFSHALDFETTISRLLRFSFFDVFFDYVPSQTYIGPLWTMQVELSGSFILLALVAVLPRTRARPWCLGIVIMAVFIFAQTDNQNLFVLFPIGALIADGFQRGWLEQLPMPAAIALLCAGIASPIVLPPAYDAANAVGTALLVMGCLAMVGVRKALSGTLSSILGTISFPLYLLHGLVLILIGEPLTRNFGHTLSERLTIDVITVVISIAAAVMLIPVNVLAIRAARIAGEAAVSPIRRAGAKLV